MIAVDTNVLVRYLAQDDELQLARVLKLFRRKNSVFYINDIRDKGTGNLGSQPPEEIPS